MAREIASPPAKPLKGSGGKEAQPPDGYSNAPHGARDAHSALPIVPVNPWHHPATATHTAPLFACSALPDLLRRQLHRCHVLIRELKPIPARLADQQVLFPAPHADSGSVRM